MNFWRSSILSTRTSANIRARPSSCSTRTPRRRLTRSRPPASLRSELHHRICSFTCLGLGGEAAERGIEGIMQRLFNRVLVTGGAGYCGARLVPQLLERGYKVTVYDIMFFGNSFLPRDNPNLRIVDGDVRDSAKFAATVAGHDAVVHLACISKDASFELDEDLPTPINLNAFEPIVLAAKKAGVKR